MEEGKRHLKDEHLLRLEVARLQGELELHKEREAELQHEVTRLKEQLTVQAGELGGKQPRTSADETLLKEMETLKHTVRKLDEELNFTRKIGRMEEKWVQLKTEHDQQQREIVTLKEKYLKQQEDLARLREGNFNQPAGALVEQVARQLEQVNTLTQEHAALREVVTSLTEAESTPQREAESARQQVAQECLGKCEKMVQEAEKKIITEAKNGCQAATEHLQTKIEDSRQQMVDRKKFSSFASEMSQKYEAMEQRLPQMHRNVLRDLKDIVGQ